MNTEHEVILNQDGEETGLALPTDFGTGLSILNSADMPDLDTAEVGTNITAQSIEFKTPGQTLRAIFAGFVMLPTKDVNTGQTIMKRSAALQTKEGIRLNMGANLLRQLDAIPVGTAMLITYKGEEKTGSGRTVKVFELNMLNVPRANATVTPLPRTPTPQPEPESGERMWTVSQKQVLVENRLATNLNNAKGMLDLSNLPGDATEAEILKWGQAYHSHRDAMNPDTGESYTTSDAALYANGDTDATSFPF